MCVYTILLYISAVFFVFFFPHKLFNLRREAGSVPEAIVAVGRHRKRRRCTSSVISVVSPATLHSSTLPHLLWSKAAWSRLALRTCTRGEEIGMWNKKWLAKRWRRWRHDQDKIALVMMSREDVSTGTPGEVPQPANQCPAAADTFLMFQSWSCIDVSPTNTRFLPSCLLLVTSPSRCTFCGSIFCLFSKRLISPFFFFFFMQQ